METVLRFSVAHAVLLGVLFFFLFFVIALTMVGVAFAQDAGAPAEAAPPDFIDLIFSTTSAAIYWLAGLIWLALKPPEWLKAFFTTHEAFKWDGIVDTGLDRAEALVRKWGHDATKDKSGWINAMVTAVNIFNPEIADYFDKNNNGVIDFVEGYIPPREPKKTKVSPGLVALIATRLPEGAEAAPAPEPEPAQGFMTAPERRGVTSSVKPRVSDDVLTRYQAMKGRVPKGATKQ